MSDEMLDRVRAWLETSGRAFELRVGRAFRQGGASRVQQSFVYTDPTTQVPREGDVLAHFGWTGIQDVLCSLTAVVECKSGSGNPWIAFYDRTTVPSSSLEAWVYAAHGPFVGITQPLAELWLGEPPFDDLQIATHVATGLKDNVNPAGDAIRQVVSATEAQRISYLKNQATGKRGVVLLPVVVTAAPLVTCRLTGDGTVDLVQVSSFIAWGHSPDGDRHKRVYVIHESQLHPFAASMSALAILAHEQARFGGAIG